MQKQIWSMFFTALIAGVCGCNSSHEVPNRSATVSGESILDRLLSKSETVKRIMMAERDLPDDKWSTNLPPRNSIINVSRDDREAVLASEILGEAMPSIKSLPAEELLQALKTYDIGSTNTFSGVRYRVYRDGNDAIIKELLSRSNDEVVTLRKHMRDGREVFTGDTGPPCTIGDVVEKLSKGRQ